jgi:hypothetical protein
MKRPEREAHYSTSSRADVIICGTLPPFSHTYSVSSVWHTYTFYLWPAMLALYVPCIMFISPFTDQKLCTILFILRNILIIAHTRLDVHWHHLQGTLVKLSFLNYVKWLKNTGWPHVIRSQFFTQNALILIIIKSFSQMFVSIKIFKNVDHFSHGMHQSVYHWNLFSYV